MENTRMPAVEVEGITVGTPMGLVHVRHARRRDGTRGVQIGVGTEQCINLTFMDYTEAVRLYEALGAALAFLDGGDR